MANLKWIVDFQTNNKIVNTISIIQLIIMFKHNRQNIETNKR
jgi:hypothetical protein